MGKGLSWFPFDVDAYLGGAVGFAMAEHGAYLMALLEQWQSRERQMIRDRDLPGRVRDKFLVMRIDGEIFLRNERLAKTWEECRRVHVQKVEAGRASQFAVGDGRPRGRATGRPTGSPAGGEMAHKTKNNVQRIIDNKQRTINSSPAAPEVLSPAEQVFAYWRERTGKSGAIFTDARREILERRLSEDPAGVDGLKLAVDGAIVDTWYNGEETGKQYWEFENIFQRGKDGRNRVEKLQSAARRGRVENPRDRSMTAALEGLASTLGRGHDGSGVGGGNGEALDRLSLPPGGEAGSSGEKRPLPGESR